MTILCIDTISSAAGVTLVTPEMVFHQSLEPMQASEGIIETIDQVLNKLDPSLAPPLSQLSGMMVIKGPGSFTGLRVGLSVANQLAHQLKLPILGLTTDAWWRFRVPDPQVFYLQSMNRSEVYVADHQQASIIPLEQLFDSPQKTWCGELKFDHLEKLPPDFSQVDELNSIESTWQKAVDHSFDVSMPRRTYDVVEPFYGKEPNITKSKKVMGI